MGVKGEFVASDVARTYCIAEHFNGQPVTVSVRFSNGLGGLKQHDGWSDVRGMAMRFHMPDGTASDLIATTLGEFFVRNVDDFFEFSKIAKREQYERRPWWLKIGDFCSSRYLPATRTRTKPRASMREHSVMPTGTGSPSWAYSRSV